jgi:hypothetical protein
MLKQELDPNLGVDCNFNSPFGPKFLDFFVKGPIREKLFEIVDRHRLANSPIEGLVEINEEWWTRGLGRGRVSHISKKIDDEEFDSFAGNTVSKLIRAYAVNYINLSADQMANGIDHDQLYVFIPTAIWWNAMKNGDFWMIHDHRGDLIENLVSCKSEGNISGNIYLKVPEQNSFPEGHINFMFGGPIEEMSNHHISYKPEEGKVYMWPSWVEHSVNPINNFDTEENSGRIVLSFNGYWRKRVQEDSPAVK